MSSFICNKNHAIWCLVHQDIIPQSSSHELETFGIHFHKNQYCIIKKSSSICIVSCHDHVLLFPYSTMQKYVIHTCMYMHYMTIHSHIFKLKLKLQVKINRAVAASSNHHPPSQSNPHNHYHAFTHT